MRVLDFSNLVGLPVSEATIVLLRFVGEFETLPELVLYCCLSPLIFFLWILSASDFAASSCNFFSSSRRFNSSYLACSSAFYLARFSRKASFFASASASSLFRSASSSRRIRIFLRYLNKYASFIWSDSLS